MDEYQGPVESQIKCTACGYDLTGVTLGTACPECGMLVTASYQASVSRKSCGQAIASMVLGIVSIMLCMCYGIPSLICGPLAIIFWYCCKDAIAAGEFAPASRGMATAGLVCGMIGTVLGLIPVGMILVALIVEFMNL
jgi:hypothetical protein